MCFRHTLPSCFATANVVPFRCTVGVRVESTAAARVTGQLRPLFASTGDDARREDMNVRPGALHWEVRQGLLPLEHRPARPGLVGPTLKGGRPP